MPTGGARARSGPAPDPDALRRERDGHEWIVLPAEGRLGQSPAWPLSKAGKREAELWRGEWKRPQAIVWERNDQQIEVALYVRSLVAAEKRDAPVVARTLVRQQQEALGISLPGLARNRWRIEEEAKPSPAAAPKRGKSARDRFKVVEGGQEGP